MTVLGTAETWSGEFSKLFSRRNLLLPLFPPYTYGRRASLPHMSTSKASRQSFFSSEFDLLFLLHSSLSFLNEFVITHLTSSSMLCWGHPFPLLTVLVPLLRRSLWRGR